MFNMLEMKRQAEIQLVCIIFFATMACSAAVRADKFPCVNNCQCYSSFSTTGDRASLHVDCRGTGITAVSSQNFMRHAWEAVSLDLGSNLISNLPAHSFSLQTHLRTLNLESNDIETVDQACFNVSSNLEHSTTSPLELINLKGKSRNIWCLIVATAFEALWCLKSHLFKKLQFFKTDCFIEGF